MNGNRPGVLKACWPLLLVLGFAACDSAPGALEPLAQPPMVSELDYTPRAVSIDDLPSAAISGDLVMVTMDISARAVDLDGDLDAVSFVIQSPVRASEAIASGELTAGAGSRFSTRVEVAFPKALTGPYVLIVYASDEAGALGNELRGTIELSATGNAPVIDEIIAPDRVQRPASGQPAVPIQLIAVVSDPDGLANVARVEVRFNGGSPLLLCDDGGQGTCNPGFASGDVTSGDGQFTLTIQVDASNSPGDRTLEFIATDRSGLQSEPQTRVLTIE
ncbi:MAG: hypothetical protein HKN29_11205 [Rhodothermales bacterium]|nr:hypothetical protein [Rhodothermales bacterium]